MPEQQNIEYKKSWRDEYLKWICGFANAQGGKIYIGIDDNGNVEGLEDYKRLMDDIPNKIVNHLGVLAEVNLHNMNGKHYIEIDVAVNTVPVSYHGIYHYRSGSTKQELKGNALNQFILKKMGIFWEQRPIPEATVNDIDEDAVKSFVRKALAKQRISENAVEADTLTVLRNLKLINEKGELLSAALLLFGKEPDNYALSAYYKIGRFGKSHADLKFQDVIKGNILDMADKVLNILDTKYLTRPISYSGLQRIEGLEYPEQALREAILNSIIHKDYSRTNIFLSVYDDRLSIWNPGELPDTLTIAKLKERHGSEPRNRLIANVFFMAGYIESWGRGIEIMMEGCKEYNIPEPLIVEEQGGLSVTFLKDIYTREYLQTLNLSERQIKGVLYAKDKGSIKNAEYQAINNVGRTVATEELQDLVQTKVLKNVGTTGRSAKYVLK